MPITAVNTMSDTTRGLVSARTRAARWAKLRKRTCVFTGKDASRGKAKKFSTTSAASSAAAPALCAAASASGRLNATLAIAERELQCQQRANE